MCTRAGSRGLRPSAGSGGGSLLAGCGALQPPKFIAPPKLEPLGSVPSVTAAGISLLLHAASPVCPEMGEMGIGGADAIIMALLRSRHACCTAADESSPLVVWVQVDDEGARGRTATRWRRTVPSARPAWALPRRCGSSGACCYQMVQDLSPPLGPPGRYHVA